MRDSKQRGPSARRQPVRFDRPTEPRPPTVIAPQAACGHGDRLRDHALQSGNPGRFEVNSSLNAVPIYERFGFAIAAPKVERYGGAYIPMVLKPEWCPPSSGVPHPATKCQ